jgi:hypothetical protein
MKQETKSEIAQLRKLKDLQVWEAEIAAQKLRIFDEQRKILYKTNKSGIATCGEYLWAQHDNGFEKLTGEAYEHAGAEIERRSIEIIFTDCDSYERIVPKNDRKFDERLYFAPLNSSNYHEFWYKFENSFCSDENEGYADFFVQIDWEFEEMRFWFDRVLFHYDLRDYGRFYFPKHVGIDPKTNNHTFEWQQI